MRILIDGVFFQYMNTGIGIVWQSLLHEWVQNGFAKNIIVMDRTAKTVLAKLRTPRVPGVEYIEAQPHNHANVEKQQEIVQQYCDEVKADVFMSTYYTSPLTTPYIMMVHDMIPEMLDMDMNAPEWKEKHAAITKAQELICISHNTANDLKHFFPEIKNENIHIVYNGVSPDFKPSSTRKIKKFKKANDLEKGYYLFVGTRTEYKNALTLFKAFRELPNYQDKTLICTGKKELESEFLSLTEGFDIRTAFFEYKELPLLYSGADALVFPSLYEGFGLPIVEAMACGCPVISSDTGALQEVGGGAPIYIEPLDYEGFADAMHKVSSDKKLRKQMSETGIVRASEFSWKKSAEQFQEIILRTMHHSIG